MRQQLIDAAVQVVGQPCEHVLEVRPRVMTMHLGGLRQAHGKALMGRQLLGFTLDSVQPGDALHRLGGYRTLVFLD